MFILCLNFLQLAFLKLNRCEGLLFTMKFIAALTTQMMDACVGCVELDLPLVYNISNICSDKKTFAGSLALYIRCNSCSSAHFSTKSLSSLFSTYPQFILWLLKSPIIIFASDLSMVELLLHLNLLLGGLQTEDMMHFPMSIVRISMSSSLLLHIFCTVHLCFL